MGLQAFVKHMKHRKPKRPEQNPLDSFDKLFGWLCNRNPGQAVQDLRAFYAERVHEFENQNNTPSQDWSKYLDWIQTFEHVPCQSKEGIWKPCTQVLETCSSEEWAHVPVKVRVPGSNVNAWV